MRRFCPILLATVLLAGCKSNSEKLVDLRTDLRTMLDELYSAYGGSSFATRADGEAQEPERPDLARAAAARLVGEMDRSWFERFCLARGRGERPFSLSGKLDAFMKEAANEKSCRDAARLQARIAELEEKAER